MSIHQPPQKSSAIFNDSNFISNNKALTLDEASKSFITYPTAQGKINLLDVDIGGTADFKSIPKTSIAPLEDNHIANKLYVDTLVGSDVTIDTAQTITGAKTFTNTTTFNGNVINNGSITTTGNSTFGDTESDEVVVNSYTWLKNDVRFGNDELTDTLLNQCRSTHQAISLFRDDVLGYPAQTNIYATSGCYLGTTSSGHAVIANSNTGFSQGGFQYRVFDKDGTPLSTPLEIQGTNNNYKTIVRSELNPQNGLTVAGTITLPADSLTISNVNTLQTELTTIKEDVILLQTNKANDIDVVHLTNNEAISGDKTFGDDVIVMGDLKFQNSSLQIVNVETEFGLKANDTDVVHLTGDETIAGIKTYSDKAIFNGDVDIGDTGLEVLTIKANSSNLGLTLMSNEVDTITGAGSFASSGIYLGRQAGNIGTFVSGSAGGTGGFQFQNKNSDGTTLNNALTISRNGNITASGDLYTQSKLISNLIENVGTNNLVIKNNGGVVKFTNAIDASNIEISANGTTTFLKRLYAKDVGSMQEKMTAANIDANEIIVDYAATSVIIIPSPSSGTGVFTTNIINMNSGAAINTSCIITLLINTATNKKYCNAITVGGTSISLLFSGGGAAIDISTSTFVQQSIAIIYTSDGDTPTYAISSVNPYLA